MHSQLEVENLLQPDQVAKLNEIGDLIAQGNKIGAIKLYREVFDTSLTEAKAAVEQLAEVKAITQIAVIPDDEGLHNRNDLTEAEIRQLLQEGKKIEAIKCLPGNLSYGPQRIQRSDRGLRNQWCFASANLKDGCRGCSGDNRRHPEICTVHRH